MSEIAEMMLDGTLCECCGEYIGGGYLGFPQYCSRQCAMARGVVLSTAVQPPITKTKCPECGKNVKFAGLRDHMRDVHKGEA